MKLVWSALVVCGGLMLLPAGMRAQLFGSEEETRRSHAWDVLHYRLELSFDQQAKSVAGTVWIRLTPLRGGVDSVVLDAVAMSVQGVRREGGNAVVYRNASPHLTLLLERSYAVGETLVVGITYSCRPEKGLYFIQADSATAGRIHEQFWSQGENSDNRYWFPCYDYPNDKATSEVIATVPEAFTLLSNGRLLSERHDARRKVRVFHYLESRPHSSYLIMVAAGRYLVVRDAYRGVPLLYYVYPEDSAKVTQTFGKTPAMMRFFEQTIGVTYPWEKYAQIVIDDFMWGGMENTTAVTLNTASMVDERAALDFPSEGVIAHELAHMWWGDYVTMRDWTDLWLNEGFATYFEALFTEASLGRDEFEYEMIQSSFAVRSGQRMLGRRPMVSHESHPVNLYARGAWVLHMLRDILGDEAFRRGLHAYIAAHPFGCAETEELRLALEDATGENLGWFFDQWVLKAGLPKLVVQKTWDERSHILHMNVAQVQERDSLTGVFRFPLTVECTTPSGALRKIFWVEKAEEAFDIALDGPPLMVIVDKGYHLLKEMEFPKPTEEHLYQLVHAEDVADRITAARALADSAGEARVRDALERSALGDPFWGVRQSALGAMRLLRDPAARAVLLRATRDAKSLVRNTAAEMLASFTGDDVANRLDSMARGDSSYLVCASALRSLATVDSLRCFEAARTLISVESYRDLIRDGALSALRLLNEPRCVEVALPFAGPPYGEESRLLSIAILGAAGRGSPAARHRLEELLRDAHPGIRRGAVTALSTWNDPEITPRLRAMQKEESDPSVIEALTRALAPSGE